jgi:hypothetical protein
MTEMKIPSIVVAGIAVALLVTACASTSGEPGSASSAAGPTTSASSVAGVATAIDGVYRWSTTEEQAIGTAAEEGIGMVWPDDAIASVPNTFTMTLDHGSFTWEGTATPQVDTGAYTVEGDTLELAWDPPMTWVLTFTYAADDDGTLHLTPKRGVDPVNEFVFTLNPWTKIG